ncbi:hypothetical protein BDZ91DRAFT_426906 [Kalaharituber pfeilii]|nr:hypothetical protein BDZ91DRAFT_426906 [Kalaharituber pfeilii]
MLKTATPNSPHAFAEGSTPPSQDSPSQLRGGPRTYLDVFNPPLDPSVLPMSPGSSPAVVPAGSPHSITGTHKSPASSVSAHAEVSCSPSNYPTSFASYAIQSHDSSGHTPGSPPSIGGQSPSLVFRGLPGSPALNIRRGNSSASINRDLEDFHLGESLNAGKGEGSILHHHHHQPHYHSKYSPRTNQRRQWSMSEMTHDDLMAAATTEEVKNPELLAQHHSDLYSAIDTQSETPDSRRTSMQDLAVPIIPIEDTTVSSSIPLYEVPSDMMVPLLDRSNDMKRLLSHRSCDRSLHILKNVLGDEVFEGKLMKLWTETDRKEVSDAEWLWRTKSLILQGTAGGDGCREWKLWGDFCAMVGFDEDDTSIDPPEEKRLGTPIETMEKIGEEEEESESDEATKA